MAVTVVPPVLAAIYVSNNLVVRLFATAGAFLVGYAAVPGLWAVVAALRAPGKQRNEARNALEAQRKRFAELLEHERKRFAQMDESHREAFQQKWHEAEDLRGQLGAALTERQELRSRLDQAEAQLAAKPITDAAPVVGTELRDIRTSIEQIKLDGQYPFGFHFPTSRWNEYEATLAQHPEVHQIVARAYTAAHGVNRKLDARESLRREGNRKPLAVKHDDGLEKVHGLAGEALDALDQAHNEPVESALQRAAREIVEDAIASGEVEDA